MKKILLILLLIPTFCEAQIINTIAGNGINGYSGDDEAATLAELSYPREIAIDGSGNLFIADYANNVIRKVSASGIISTVAGNDTAGYSGDGGAATAGTLNIPEGVCIDDEGNILIADELNSRIRKVNSAGIISTIAGTNTAGYSGDGGPATAAKLHFPTSIITDASGNIFIAEEGNNVIRKINTFGIISTIAGNDTVGYSGDGGAATAAELNDPRSIVFDSFGDLYIADAGNNVVRELNTSGIINTIAGNGIVDSTGDGGPATNATLDFPDGAAFDGSGNLYVADGNNNVIRMINTSGIISRVAGNGFGAGTYSGGYSGNGGAAISAEISLPTGIIFDNYGNLLISDWGNHVIRKVSYNLLDVTLSQNTVNSVKIFPNPISASLTIVSTDKIINLVTISNLFGQTIYSHLYNEEQVQLDVSNLAAGVYIIKVNDTDVKKFVKQ